MEPVVLLQLPQNYYVVVPLANGGFSIFRLKSRAMPIGNPALPDNFVSSGRTIHKTKMVVAQN